MGKKGGGILGWEQSAVRGVWEVPRSTVEAKKVGSGLRGLGKKASEWAGGGLEGSRDHSP